MKTSNPKAPSLANMKKAWETRAKYAERFWSFVKKTDTCWLFKNVTKKGYGRYGFENIRMQAHPYAKIITSGIPDEGSLCLHSCVGVRNCVNPRHLRWHDHNENMGDVVRDHRSNPRRGADAPAAKLKAAEAVAIWIEYSKYGSSAKSIAERLGKPVAVVKGVIHEQRYADVTGVLKNAYPKPGKKVNNAPTGEDAPTSRMTFENVTAIRCQYGRGLGIHAIAVANAQSPGSVSAVVKRNTWQEVDELCLLGRGNTKGRPRIIAKKDVLEAIRRKMAVGKSLEWCAQRYTLPVNWLADEIKRKNISSHDDCVSYWARKACELSDLEVVTIWRLGHQAQKSVKWLCERFSTKEDAVRSVLCGYTKPHLIRRLALVPSDGKVVIGREGTSNPCAKLTEKDVQKIRYRVAAGEKDAKIAKSFSMSAAGIASIRRGQTYKNIPWPAGIDRGELNRIRILADEDVICIHNLAVNATDTVGNLAKAYKTSVVTVRNIRDGKSYKSVLENAKKKRR